MRVVAGATRWPDPRTLREPCTPLRASDHRLRPDKLRAVGARLAPPSAHVTMHDYKQTVNKSMRAGDAQQRAGRAARDICEQRGELVACGQTTCRRDASKRGRRLGRSGAAAPPLALSEAGDVGRGGLHHPAPRPALAPPTRTSPGPRHPPSPPPLWQPSSTRPMHSILTLITGDTLSRATLLQLCYHCSPPAPPSRGSPATVGCCLPYTCLPLAHLPGRCRYHRLANTPHTSESFPPRSLASGCYCLLCLAPAKVEAQHILLTWRAEHRCRPGARNII